MIDVVDIVLKKEKMFFSGVYRLSAAKPYRPIILDGKQKIPWTDGCWEAIFTNLQISPEAEICRVLVTSDIPLNESTFPHISANQTSWNIQEVSELIRKENSIPSGWVLNGVSLNGRIRKLFPCNPTEAKNLRYIYTIPMVMLGETKSPSDILRKIEPL